jgi:hypothetical protein
MNVQGLGQRFFKQPPAHKSLPAHQPPPVRKQPRLRSAILSPLCATLAMGGATALLLSGIANAQQANFGTLELDQTKTSGSLSGSTGGSTSLPAILANRDRRQRRCLGFADPTPDHILVLKRAVPRLVLQVNSNGADTTLVVQGPNAEIRCGDDTGSSADASIRDTDWAPGTYKIWVGSAAPGRRQNYTLNIRP